MNETNVKIREEDVRQAKDTALGGKLFAGSVVLNDVSTPLLHTAIRMSAEEFHGIDGSMSRFWKLANSYELLCTMLQEDCFPFRGATAVKDLAVFTFHTSGEWECLALHSQSLSAQAALDVFRHLLLILERYGRCAINDKGYRPLLFLCRDSVFVSYDESGALTGVRLLPSPYDIRCDYAGMPRDICRGKADITDDIAMAAYLYLQLKYPNGEPFAQDEYAVYDELAERCLSPFVQRRPTLEELFCELELYPDTAPVSDKPAEGSGVPVRIVPADDGPVEHQKGGYLDRLFRRKKNRKTITGTLSGVRDKFDEVFSTEQGDSEEAEDND